MVRLRRSFLDVIDRLRYARQIEIVNSLPLFAPYSDGSYKARADLTILAANQTFPFLVNLLNVTDRNRLVCQARDFCAGEGSQESAGLLKCLLDKYGSDKSNPNDYHLIYGFILNRPNSASKVLEIGLGTNNKDVVSHMGRAGRPGASLRAFRDFLPNAKIYGADVDKRILFEEERINTFFVDQTDLRSFDVLGRSVGTNFDLIIDDGLHSPNANIAVLTFALSRLKPGGWLVVEDIPGPALPVWQVVTALLPPAYVSHLVSCKDKFAFVVKKTSGS